jgi:hypothetical protein
VSNRPPGKVPADQLGLIPQYTSNDQEIEELPLNDARNVTTHIYSNILRTKDPEFVQYFPPEGEQWHFVDAYTFHWTDDRGQVQRILIAEYDNRRGLLQDYLVRTNPIRPSERVSTFLSNEIATEDRSVPEFGGGWRGLSMGNMLLLVSGGTLPADQEEMFSHFLTITAAGHRDAVPTATPRP